MILYLIGRLGAASGDGYAVEYAGPAVKSLGVEARLTLCNLCIELGAKIGRLPPTIQLMSTSTTDLSLQKEAFSIRQ